MKLLSDRIRDRRVALGLTQEELATKLGYRDKSSIHRIEAQKADIPAGKLAAFAAALQTSPAYLGGSTDDPYDYGADPERRVDSIPASMFALLRELFGDDYPAIWSAFKKGNLVSATPATEIPGSEPLPEMQNLPLVGPVACGTPILAEENIEGNVGVPAMWRADFVLRCKGDSMAPEIQDGDIVAVRRQERVEEGQIAVVLDMEECAATLKHFHQPAPDVVMLTPNNPAFAPLYFAGEKINDLKIEGLAVGICRGLV